MLGLRRILFDPVNVLGLTNVYISGYLDIWNKMTLYSPFPRSLSPHGWKRFVCLYSMSRRGFPLERFHVCWMFRKIRCPRTWGSSHVQDSSRPSGIAGR